MSYPKPKRIKDKDALRQCRKQGICLYGIHTNTQCSDGLDPHHITTRGAGGDDAKGNLILLCRKHHNDAHKGLISKQKLYAILSAHEARISPTGDDQFNWPDTMAGSEFL